MTGLVKGYSVCEIALPVAQMSLSEGNDRLRHSESCYDEAVTLEVCSSPVWEEFEASPVCTLERHG